MCCATRGHVGEYLRLGRGLRRSWERRARGGEGAEIRPGGGGVMCIERVGLSLIRGASVPLPMSCRRTPECRPLCCNAEESTASKLWPQNCRFGYRTSLCAPESPRSTGTQLGVRPQRRLRCAGWRLMGVERSQHTPMYNAAAAVCAEVAAAESSKFTCAAEPASGTRVGRSCTKVQCLRVRLRCVREVF